MKLLFVSGPFRASNSHDMADNTESAARVGLALWRMGAAVICPHLNTGRFLGMLDEERVRAGHLALLERCDGLVLTGGWSASDGASDERERARIHEIPVFEWPAQREEIRAFLSK